MRGRVLRDRICVVVCGLVWAVHRTIAGASRPPTPRNVALTTIRDAGANPNLDDQIRPLALSREERQVLAAFLRALTGSAYVRAVTSPRE